MPAVKIPGAASIDPVAPARDPGVSASPEDFGAGVGVSTAHFGDALASLGAHLYQKRQAAEDDIYVQKHYVDSAVRIEQAQIKAKQDYPDGGPGYMEALNTGIQQANDSVTADLAARGLTPSQAAASHVAKRFAGVQSNVLVNGVAYDNNAQVKKLQDASSDTINTLASGTKAGTMKLDDGIKGVDDVVSSAKGVYGGEALRNFENTSKKLVVNGEIERLTNLGLVEEAGKLRDKWYGHTVAKGEGNAGAVVTTAENLGIQPRVLAAAISYETGGKMNPSMWGGKGNNYLGLIQFGPEERAKYGVRPGMTFAEQMPAVESFLRDRGVKPGMGIAEVYSIINAGSLTPNGQPRWDRSDGNGTIASHVDKIQREHLPLADKFLTGATAQGGEAPLLPDTKLSEHWQKQFEAQRTDMVRADQIQKIEERKRSDASEGAYLKDLFGENPQTTVRQIVNDDTLTREAKERMVGVANRALKEEPLAKRSQQTTMGLIDRIRRPDGDPQKITDLNPLFKAYTDGEMTRADFEFAKKQFTEGASDDGSSLAKTKNAFVKQAGDAISLANLSSSMTGGGGTFQKYNFERYVDSQVEKYRAAKKDPAALFDPNSPDYLGKLDSNGRPAVLKPFLKDLQTGAREEAAEIKAPTKQPAPSSPAERQRLDEWLKQRGGIGPLAGAPPLVPTIQTSQ